MNQYKNLKFDAFETDKINEMEKNLSKYRENRKNAIDLALNNKNQEAYEYYETNVRHMLKLF